MKNGRDLDMTYDECVAMFKKVKDLKKGESSGTTVRCTNNRCRNGLIHNVVTRKSTGCPICKGYGFTRRGA